MNALAVAVTAMLVPVPKEYHIDFSGWPGTASVKIDYRFTPVKGQGINVGLRMEPDTSPTDVRDEIERSLRDAGWGYRTVGKGILIVEAAKGSAVRSIEFKSKDWKPDVRVVLVPPK